ncbi:hypothetical protein BKA70DRAFT_1342261 [Coprinopsis sp. MPI-PUGE-AT-0042]|nr:hypothetical protein BKA70DRAFT_1342261 [Coprinopsis sp. MPI-PUGE-AT-0042]
MLLSSEILSHILSYLVDPHCVEACIFATKHELAAPLLTTAAVSKAFLYESRRLSFSTIALYGRAEDPARRAKVLAEILESDNSTIREHITKLAIYYDNQHREEDSDEEEDTAAGAHSSNDRDQSPCSNPILERCMTSFVPRILRNLPKLATLKIRVPSSPFFKDGLLWTEVGGSDFVASFSLLIGQPSFISLWLAYLAIPLALLLENGGENFSNLHMRSNQFHFGYIKSVSKNTKSKITSLELEEWAPGVPVPWSTKSGGKQVFASLEKLNVFASEDVVKADVLSSLFKACSDSLNDVSLDWDTYAMKLLPVTTHVTGSNDPWIKTDPCRGLKYLKNLKRFCVSFREGVPLPENLARPAYRILRRTVIKALPASQALEKLEVAITVPPIWRTIGHEQARTIKHDVSDSDLKALEFLDIGFDDNRTEYIELENVLHESARFGASPCFRHGFQKLLCAILDALREKPRSYLKLRSIDIHLTLSLPNGILQNMEGRRMDTKERFMAALKATVAGVKELLGGVDQTPLDGKDVSVKVTMLGQVEGHHGLLEETETIIVATA